MQNDRLTDIMVLEQKLYNYKEKSHAFEQLKESLMIDLRTAEANEFETLNLTIGSRIS